MMKTKQELCIEMASKNYSIPRIAKVLRISERQVVKLVLDAAIKNSQEQPEPEAEVEVSE